jgi:hypothetical protein
MNLRSSYRLEPPTRARLTLLDTPNSLMPSKMDNMHWKVGFYGFIRRKYFYNLGCVLF